MTRPFRRAVLGASLPALLAGCPSQRAHTDASVSELPEPETRYGNDPELLADFENLARCTYEAGRIDQACPQVQTLRLRLETKRQTPSRHRKAVATLANLLGSRKERTRLAVAENLFAVRREPAIVAALEQRLPIERVPAIKAAMLRHACWTLDAWVEKQAASLLGASRSDDVRAAAAACLGQDGPLTEAGARALRRALTDETSPQVLGAACASVAARGMRAALPQVAALLDREDVGWRCAPALARLGGQEAYRALLDRAAKAQGPIHPAFVRALTSFAGETFYDAERVGALRSP